MKQAVANGLPIDPIFSFSFVSNRMILRHQSVIKVPEIEFNVVFFCCCFFCITG